VILEAAAEGRQVVLTADADFSTMLALQGRSQPSVLMLRSSDHLTPDEQADLILRTLEQVGGELEDGAIASVTPERIRIRTLPISHP
jgi:predicted nuclease of predicted toxin-antitoxin system